MKKNTIAIKMTPFIFEDGKTYYFEIHEQDDLLRKITNNDYHDLYVYKKVVTKRKFLWWKWENIRYDLINESPEWVSTKLNSSEIKADIKKVIIAESAKKQIKGWDGFVGDVPQEIKAAHKRDSKISDLIGEESHLVRSRIFRANSGSSD